MVQFPEPEMVPAVSKDYQSTQMYPYYSLGWVEGLQRFNGKVPFEIVSKADGTSHCIECKQLYSGFQAKCVRPTWKYKTTGYTHYKVKGCLTIGQYTGRGELVNWSEEDDCDGYCTWSHEVDFTEQQRFFNFCERLIHLDSERVMLDTELSMNVPDAFSETDRLKMIALFAQQRLATIEQTLKNHDSMLQEIAGRIQGAGASLGGFRY